MTVYSLGHVEHFKALGWQLIEQQDADKVDAKPVGQVKRNLERSQCLWFDNFASLPEGTLLYAERPGPAMAGDALSCRDLSDVDMDRITDLIAAHDRGDIGYQGLCDTIIKAFAVQPASGEDA